ncbi:MAG: transposase family protein [Gammaproteobacteria bacterium]|nr:transposase family protein [Gammaproteobacteria bacterium]MBU1505808.1 transposase family protein [Gammaproteobacteria bacterium]MBU2119496.1 transposase family protein [Gammaproteobacteria bacterium]MBU2172598.1 transposase family protein [Gammaproteobacteria bacterium]MBU2202056.1 transposase family protein [Gammaproteobacteria bacterium]
MQPHEVSTDMAALSPEACDYVRQLARRLDDSEHGNGTAMVREAGEFLGVSVQTVYRHLKAVAGWSSGRKARCDKGSTSVSAESLVTMGAAQREAIRANGKQTLFTTTARGILEQNGHAFGVSNGQLNKLMRDRKLNVAAQRIATPVQALRAPHPNHTHEVDPSLCLVYYLKGRQYIIRDDEFYKNKLDKLAQVKFKCYRYVAYDRASACVVPWYTEAAGEDQHNLFKFLMFSWGLQSGRPFHGVPFNLLWDKGSANQSTAIRSMLDALGVNHETHKAGNSRAKGGAENGNNIVETQFESRLRFQPVDNVEQLNAAAGAWANAYNANLIPGQDTRLRRAGLPAPVARYDLWQLITAEQLRVLPAVEVCQAFMRSKEEERQVKPDLTITFRHPAAERTMPYSLRGLDGINVGDVVLVRGLIYGECAVQVQVLRYDGEPLIYRVEPNVEFDAFGQRADGAVIGSEYKRAAKTEAEHAATAMDGAAYPGMTADEVQAARQKRATPFGGQINAHQYLQDIEMPAYLPRQGTAIETPACAEPAGPELLDPVTAMLRIVGAIGRNLAPEENAFFMKRYADGVPEDQVVALIGQYLTPAMDQQPMRAAGGLRAV